MGCGRDERSRVRGPWGVHCGCSFKLMDLSFPGKRSHFLSVCLSPALLLNQGEWSFPPGFTRKGGRGGGVREGQGLELLFRVRFEAG